jgi:hypothetical protein
MKLVRLAIVAAALAAAVVPTPPELVEIWYSLGLYPQIQRALTSASNLSPVALFDVAFAALLAIAIARVARWRARGGAMRTALPGAALGLVTFAAVLYLAFLLLWGLNYRRTPLERKLEFDRARVTHEALRRLGERAVQTINTGYIAAHEARPDPGALEAAFASAERAMRSGPTVTGIPKRSLLELYFRKAGIDGMTDPLFLEVIINPDTLRFERPFVLAHEWAHLAGYANEAEANFIAWLACLHGDASAQYSGWLALYEHVVAALPKSERPVLAAKLDPGPRGDLDEIAARYERTSPIVRNAARDVYDTYLRANRVSEGIASYTGVVRLVLGSGAVDGNVQLAR